MARKLDARTAKNLQPGEWASAPIAGKRGGGILQARGLSNGATAFYFRITTSGKRERIALGAIPYREAVKRASELSLRYQQGERELPEALKAEQAAKQKAREETQATKARTLGALLVAYCDNLDHKGRKRVADVRRSIARHVEKPWPKLWKKQADSVTPDDLVDVVGRVSSAGNLSEARRLRAYIRAAYAAGIAARRDAMALPVLRELRITSNPAALLAPVDDANTTRERVLSLAELRAYWRRIAAMSGIDGGLLRFHLLTGGQRLEQLARATVADHDADTQTLRLLDPKGRRSVPRVHTVPLLPEALAAMDDMHAGASGPYVFTVTTGKTGGTYHVTAKRLRAVVAAMLEAGEAASAFTLGDLRRTVETRLAAAGVSRETRAHLQSHGMGGLQARHYDRHDYLAEKRAALETLLALCTAAPAANVVPLRGRKVSE